MQRTVFAFAFLAALLVPAVSAGSPESPEVTDPAGDVDAYPGVPVPPGTADGVDVVATWFHDETDASVQVTMKVTKLEMLPAAGTVPMSMLRLGTRFSTPYIPTDSDEYWDNTWVASATYSSGAWRARLQPPSVDGMSPDATDLDMTVDEAAGTVTLTLPRDLLGSPKAGQQLTTIHSLHDMTWPTYGGFFIDQGPDSYSDGGSYTFKGPVDPQAGPSGGGAASGAGKGPEPSASGGGSGGSTQGSNASSGSGSATSGPDREGPGPDAVEAAEEQAGAVRGDARAKAPGPAAALLGLTLLALATGRRRR